MSASCNFPVSRALKGAACPGLGKFLSVSALASSLPPKGTTRTSRAVAALSFSVLSKEIARLLVCASCEEELWPFCKPCDDLSHCFFWVN